MRFLAAGAVGKLGAFFASYFSMAAFEDIRWTVFIGADREPVFHEVEGSRWEEQFRRSFPTQSFSWPGIDFPCDVIELLLGKQGKVGSLRQVLPE